MRLSILTGQSAILFSIIIWSGDLFYFLVPFLSPLCVLFHTQQSLSSTLIQSSMGLLKHEYVIISFC